MSRQDFRILVVLSQLLALGIIAVQYATENSLPPELLSYLNDYETILIPDRYSLVELATDVPFLLQTFLGILAAVGLFLFRRWGRTVFLICLLTELAVTVLTGPHVNTGWTMLVGYIYSIIEGVILALIYFSPIKEMFETEGEL